MKSGAKQGDEEPITSWQMAGDREMTYDLKACAQGYKITQNNQPMKTMLLGRQTYEGVSNG